VFKIFLDFTFLSPYFLEQSAGPAIGPQDSEKIPNAAFEKLSEIHLFRDNPKNAFPCDRFSDAELGEKFNEF
jgi:hypothetical protein